MKTGVVRIAEAGDVQYHGLHSTGSLRLPQNQLCGFTEIDKVYWNVLFSGFANWEKTRGPRNGTPAQGSVLVLIPQLQGSGIACGRKTSPRAQ